MNTWPIDYSNVVEERAIENWIAAQEWDRAHVPELEGRPVRPWDVLPVARKDEWRRVVTRPVGPMRTVAEVVALVRASMDPDGFTGPVDS